MTSTADLALHSAIWGEPEAVLDAIDDGTFRPELFGPHEPVARVIVDLVLAGTVPWPANILAAVMAAGHAQADAVDMILAGREVFEAAGYRLDGLPHWLHLLADEAQRRELDLRLLRAGEALAVPGGAERARELLREVAA